jgi:hypothetical protein
MELQAAVRITGGTFIASFVARENKRVPALAALRLRERSLSKRDEQAEKKQCQFFHMILAEEKTLRTSIVSRTVLLHQQFDGLSYSSGSSATAAAPRFEGRGFLGAVT